MVTDVYEWGWGQSFHFSPLLPGKSVRESEAAHEARLAAIIGGVLGGVVLIVLVVAGLYFFCVHRRHGRPYFYQDAELSEMLEQGEQAR